MINGLGLLAPLAGVEPAPPAAPSEDPALFAAALAAALGLTPPVATPAPVAPVVVADSDAEAPSDQPTDKDAQPETFGATVTAESPDADVARPAAPARTPKRVTLTLEASRSPTPQSALPGTTPPVDAKELGETASPGPLPLTSRESNAGAIALPDSLRCRIPQPTEETVAVHAMVTEMTGTLTAASAGVALPPADRNDRSAESVPLPLSSDTVTDASPVADSTATAVADAPAGSASVARPKRDNSSSEADPTPAAVVAPDPAVPAMVVSTMAAGASLHPAPEVQPDLSNAGRDVPPAVPSADELSTSQPIAPVARQADPARGTQSAATPSRTEQSARAIAENTRVGRQLAEILGDADLIDVQVQLASRRGQITGSADNADVEGETPVTPPAADAPTPVRWQRAQADRSIARPVLVEQAIESARPAPLRRDGESRTTDRATLRPDENPSEVKAVPLTGEPVTPGVPKQPLKSNAERLTADLAPLERAVRQPLAPSLPVDRQELPASSSLTNRPGLPEPEQKRSRTETASEAVPASSALEANRTPSAARETTAAEARGSSEARNLPSDGSTDAKAAGSSDRVTLQVADDDGRQTRIRVTVTGTQIRAVITPPDNASARQLEQRMDQLTETLIRQGYADPKVTVRTAAESMGDQAVAFSTAGGAQDVRSAGPASREQPAGDNRQGRGQRDQDRSGDGHRHPQGQPRDRDPRDRRK